TYSISFSSFFAPPRLCEIISFLFFNTCAISFSFRTTGRWRSSTRPRLFQYNITFGKRKEGIDYEGGGVTHGCARGGVL
ncbi:MAG: hypothetical protein WC637_14610, partial [Victivallales bacterium]